MRRWPRDKAGDQALQVYEGDQAPERLDKRTSTCSWEADVTLSVRFGRSREPNSTKWARMPFRNHCLGRSRSFWFYSYLIIFLSYRSLWLHCWNNIVDGLYASYLLNKSMDENRKNAYMRQETFQATHNPSAAVFKRSPSFKPPWWRRASGREKEAGVCRAQALGTPAVTALTAGTPASVRVCASFHSSSLVFI